MLGGTTAAAILFFVGAGGLALLVLDLYLVPGAESETLPSVAVVRPDVHPGATIRRRSGAQGPQSRPPSRSLIGLPSPPGRNALGPTMTIGNHLPLDAASWTSSHDALSRR